MALSPSQASAPTAKEQADIEQVEGYVDQYLTDHYQGVGSIRVSLPVYANYRVRRTVEGLYLESGWKKAEVKDTDKLGKQEMLLAL